MSDHDRRQPSVIRPNDVIAFWREAGPEKWFAKDAAFDAAIRESFGAAHDTAANGAFADWQTSAEGALALLLLLDPWKTWSCSLSPRTRGACSRSL